MTPPVRRATTVAAALTLHAAVIVGITWPLATQLATHVPGQNPDNLLLAWVLARESQALTNAWAGIPTAGIFHPTPDSLYYGEVAFGALPLFLPVFWATGNAALALDLTYLVGILLTAMGLHLLVARRTGSDLAGVLTAWTVLLTPWTLRGWVRTAPTYAILPYLPLVFCLLARPRLGVGALALLSAALVAQGLVSPYLAVAVLAPVGIVAGWRLVRQGARSGGLALAVALLVAAVVLHAAYGGYRRVWAANPRLASQTLYSNVGPHDLQRLDDLDRASFPFAVPRPCLLVILAGALARRGGKEDESTRRAWRQGVLWTALGFGLFAGRVQLGDHVLELPIAWAVHLLPTLRRMRDPVRLGVLTLVGLAVLTGLAFDACVRRLPAHAGGGSRFNRALLAIVVAGAMVWGFRARLLTAAPRDALFRFAQATMAPRAVPTLDPRLSEMLAQSNGALLELPIGPGPDPHAEAMYRAIAHGRPLVNGYHGYWPADFPRRMELACRLPDPTALAALSETTGLKLILVHTKAPLALDATSRPPYGCAEPAPRAAAWEALRRTGGQPGLALVARAGTDLLFAVEPTAGEQRATEPGKDIAKRPMP